MVIGYLDPWGNSSSQRPGRTVVHHIVPASAVPRPDQTRHPDSRSDIGALIIRLRLGGPLYYTSNKGTPKIV